FAWLTDTTYTQRLVLSQYLKYFSLDADISANDFIVWLREHYKIDYTVSSEDARTMIGLRYELESRVITAQDTYIFAGDASTDFISVLKERNYPGVSVETAATRVYTTKSASHILGYVGKMNAEEYETYKEDGYSIDTYIGKDGVEKAFEEYLHGTDGEMRVVYSEDTDAVVSTEILKEASNGNNVYLTLDIGLQEVAEKALEDKINEINEDRTSDNMATGGAVVVTDVKSGGILACASYPTFDISTFFDNYSDLMNDATAPLFNRAINGTYNPGSTYKMVTGFAGLKAGYISRTSTITDNGFFDKYDDYQPRCWVYSTSGGGHGPLDIVDALRYSCNVFFFTVGDAIGSAKLKAAAEEFGFGTPTGIEIGDSSGVIASKEYKNEVLGEAWYSADTLLASIGQGQNMFTPVQLSNYAATIASGGIRYRQTLLDTVMNPDYTDTVYEKEPEIAYEFTAKEKEYISILQEGMEAVANKPGGSGYDLYSNYKVTVAAKTGTVQNDSGNSNNGVFVCYAPADNPEIAIAVIIERGSAGRNVMTVTKNVMDYYFGTHVESVTINGEGVLLP
ncbi:MAG: penicillin-binding protein, partial [Oscillospiraceae bacterium]|nr:penicillin-binding protein [Oscillospiraceae bacterium]